MKACPNFDPLSPMDSVTMRSEEPPNWLDLPREITLAILGKIGAFDILNHVQFVCTSWNTLCKDPSIWSSIDMLSCPDDLLHADLLAREAVDRSCGQLIDISIAHFPDNGFIRYLAKSSGQLRRLQIVSCPRISNNVLKHTASKFAMLEELKIQSTSLSIDAVKAIGSCCPQLKIFKCNVFKYIWGQAYHENLAKMIGKTMPQLYHLELLWTKMRNDGQKAILDGCPRLETLVLCSSNIDIDVDDLGETCSARFQEIVRYQEEPDEDAWCGNGWMDGALLSDCYSSEEDDSLDFDGTSEFSIMATNKVRWGELEEDDGEVLLQPRQIIGPDENGIKKIIEYKFDDEGNKVKIATTMRVRKLAKARLSKRAVERRSWAKFGDAVHEDVGARLTMVSTEEILLERPRAPGTKADDNKSSGDSLARLGKGCAVLMVCRTCGKKGDHWTSKCPYKDLAAPVETFVDKPIGSKAAAATGAGGKGSYVPPSMRTGAERPGVEMRRRNDENSVRVTNLSEDTIEADLHELFRPFGAISRVYVAMDQKTGVCRGFGFVNFVNKEDTERAINNLNGYGYDNLILRVEWATPRTN